jgi:hypothetical protein
MATAAHASKRATAGLEPDPEEIALFQEFQKFQEFQRMQLAQKEQRTGQPSNELALTPIATNGLTATAAQTAVKADPVVDSSTALPSPEASGSWFSKLFFFWMVCGHESKLALCLRHDDMCSCHVCSWHM